MGIFDILSKVVSTSVENHKRNVNNWVDKEERELNRAERSGQYSERAIAQKREKLNEIRDRYNR